jgi:ZIP family zinc transporter
MLEAAFWALIGASSLLIGVEIALALRPAQRIIGLVMAFGAGAMISAVAYELVLEAVEHDEYARVVIGMALGSGAFLLGSLAIDRAGGSGRKRSTGEQEEGSPLAIVLGAALDGIPESIIIGLTVILTGGVSASFVLATFLSNLPESMAATSGLTTAGWSRSSIRRLWASVVGVAVLSGALGYILFDTVSSATGALVEGFAAGALLTMLADTMMPEAFHFGGRLVGIFTVAGFAAAFLIAGI